MRRVLRLKWMFFLAASVACFGCSAPSKSPGFEVRFQVVSDDGLALAGVAIAARGQRVGSTNESGVLRASIEGLEGDAVPVRVQCGSEYRELDRLAPLKLTTTRRITSSPGIASIPYEAVCTRKQRNVVVVAHADKLAGIPITVDGRQVAVTDTYGNAHALVPLDASTALLHVAFDTASRPELLPKNPGRACGVAPGDDIVILDQKFTLVAKTGPRRFVSPPKHIPVRIQ